MVSVGDLMTVNPVTVKPSASLREVLTLMKEEECRQLLVESEEGKLIGIITDRDVRLAMNSPIVLHERWQDEELLNHASAVSCMSRDPITVSPDTPAYRAAEMLSAYKFGALPVIDAEALVGIISVTDLLEQFIEDHRGEGMDEV